MIFTTLIKIRYPDDVRFTDVHQWLENNCTGKFYNGTDWDNWEFGKNNRCVEFEDPESATLFALRWS